MICHRVAAALALFATVLPLIGGQGSEATQSEPQSGQPTVFRKLGAGDTFPKLALESTDGKPVKLDMATGKPGVIAFLRPDQSDSLALFADLQELVITSKSLFGRVAIIGLPGRDARKWKKLAKGIPQRLDLLLDDHSAAKTVGVVAVPCIALVDRDARLRRTFILYDEKTCENLLREAQALAAGKSVPKEGSKNLALFDAAESNALGLEAKGQAEQALVIRKHQLRLGIRMEHVHLCVGRLLYELNKPLEAKAYFLRSDALQPSLHTRTWVGLCLCRMGKDDAAEAILLKGLGGSAMKHAAHRALAEIYGRREQLDKALDHIKAAIRAVDASGASGVSDDDK